MQQNSASLTMRFYAALDSQTTAGGKPLTGLSLQCIRTIRNICSLDSAEAAMPCLYAGGLKQCEGKGYHLRHPDNIRPCRLPLPIHAHNLQQRTFISDLATVI